MPLILSLQLDAEAHAYFNALREQYFPAALNLIPAHVTLFHHLPDAGQDALLTDIRRECARQAAFAVTVTGLRNLGRGVAYTLESHELLALRQRLAAAWWEWLTPQDRQKFKPHVTIQNKVAPEVARATLFALQAAWQPPTAVALGLHLWIYRQGPWEHLATTPFCGTSENFA